MCQFSIFTFLCGGQKLKITSPCEHFSANYQGIQFCRLDPQAHVNDDRTRNYSEPTFGPGICININCRESYGMHPHEVASNSHACDLIEDDSGFDMSAGACTEREMRWYRLLSTDQQLECLSTTFPVSFNSMSQYAKTYLYLDLLPATEWFAHFEAAWDANPDSVTWQELNPRYMTAHALQAATVLHLLPAWVTDTKQPVPNRNKKTKQQQVLTTTPLMPLYGPFKVGTHTCTPRVGFCKICGHYHGKQHRHRPFTFHATDYAAAQASLALKSVEYQNAMQQAAWKELTHERGGRSMDMKRQEAAAGGHQDLAAPSHCGTIMPATATTHTQQIPNAPTQNIPIPHPTSLVEQFDFEVEAFDARIDDARQQQDSTSSVSTTHSSTDQHELDFSALLRAGEEFDLSGMGEFDEYTDAMMVDF